jgi:hypothetical protein
MAVFVLTITTPASRQPATRADDVTERARLQELLLTVASIVSNTGAYTGDATGARGGRAEFTYEVGEVSNAA